MTFQVIALFFKLSSDSSYFSALNSCNFDHNKRDIMKIDKILLAVLLLIIAYQTRSVLEPEIRKIQRDKQNLSEVITRFCKGLTAFEREETSKPTTHCMGGDDACKSILLSFKLPLTRVNIVILFGLHRLNQNLKTMIVLKSDYFCAHRLLICFINENHIKREDILVITPAPGFFTIFFYVYDAVEEISHGCFPERK